MAPFFILFYGLMMADMGYGLIMIAAALVAMRKMKPREGNLAFCQLLLYGGIATFLMGVLTGGLFSDIPYQLVHLLTPKAHGRDSGTSSARRRTARWCFTARWCWDSCT